MGIKKKYFDLIENSLDCINLIANNLEGKFKKYFERNWNQIDTTISYLFSAENIEKVRTKKKRKNIWTNWKKFVIYINLLKNLKKKTSK